MGNLSKSSDFKVVPVDNIAIILVRYIDIQIKTAVYYFENYFQCGQPPV